MKLASKFTNYTSLNRFSLILTSCAVLGLISSKPSIAAVMYSVTDIGTLSGSRSSANDINDNGQVVGTLSTTTGGVGAFLWDSTNGITILDPNGINSSYVYGNGINNNGQVVGSYFLEDGSNSRAFLWDSVNGLQNLGTLPGDSSSTANQINDKGQVVGRSEGFGRGQPFLWDSVNGLQNLGTLNGYNFSGAYDINNNGEVVGFASNGVSVRAVLWDSSKGIQDLGSLVGTRATSPFSINDAGTAVGDSRNGNFRAFLWDRTKGIQNLGTLDGFPNSFARDINNNGQIVGFASSSTFSNSRAVLWENSIATDLNALIDPSSGWTLGSATAINNKGQIIASGALTLNNQIFGGSVLLTPLTQIPKSIPEATSGLGLCAFTLGSIYGLKRRYAKSSPISKNKRTLKIAGS